MSCYFPLHAFDTGYKTDNGKPRYKITSGDIECTEYHGKWLTDYIDIPCGKCIGCRLDYSLQWANRCMLEAQYHDKNCFITLTYDDDHLPDKNPVFDSDGVYIDDSPRNPLVKDDFRRFMKNFRQRLVDNYVRDNPNATKSELPRVRFYACGEYGGKTFRPHYHAIIFGYDFSDDRILYKKNFRGENYYISHTLADLWSYGFHTICDVSFDTCAYVARYILKKQKGETSDIYEKLQYPPEFTLMSRKPGIARQYYDDHRDEIYINQEIFIATDKDGKKLRPPKYYDKLYDLDNPEDMERIRLLRRESMEHKNNIADSLTSLSHNDRLRVQAEVKEARTKILQERSKFYESSV